MRSLLDTIEHYLKEFDFPDPYQKQKQEENQAALALLPEQLQALDALEWRERQETLVLHVLAGNMFDWGAKEVAKLLEDKSVEFGFKQALNTIPCKSFIQFIIWTLLHAVTHRPSVSTETRPVCNLFS